MGKLGTALTFVGIGIASAFIGAASKDIYEVGKQWGAALTSYLSPPTGNRPITSSATLGQKTMEVAKSPVDGTGLETSIDRPVGSAIDPVVFINGKRVRNYRGDLGGGDGGGDGAGGGGGDGGGDGAGGCCGGGRVAPAKRSSQHIGGFDASGPGPCCGSDTAQLKRTSRYVTNGYFRTETVVGFGRIN